MQAVFFLKSLPPFLQTQFLLSYQCFLYETWTHPPKQTVYWAYLAFYFLSGIWFLWSCPKLYATTWKQKCTKIRMWRQTHTHKHAHTTHTQQNMLIFVLFFKSETLNNISFPGNIFLDGKFWLNCLTQYCPITLLSLCQYQTTHSNHSVSHNT